MAMVGAIKPVTGSSFITGIGYDPDSETLTLQFSNGKSFEYSGVPEGVFQAMSDADSMGGFWHANIKDQYNSRRA